MSLQKLVPELITVDRFAPFGQIIQRNPEDRISINNARFDRYVNLANIDADKVGGYTNVSIFNCREATELPYEISMVERHPLGSQAFIPLSRFAFVVVVAPPGDTVNTNDLRAFITNGIQGVNLFRGVWHIPLIGFEVGQEFLVIDRGGGHNCDEFDLPTNALLTEH